MELEIAAITEWPKKTENTTIIVDLTILGPDFQKILGKT